MGGPMRTPTIILQRRGSWRGEARMKDGEVKYEPYGKTPPPPEWLETYARAEWMRITPILMGQGILTPADRAMLAAYCLSYGEMIEADKVVHDTGYLVETECGGTKINPAVGARSDAARRVAQFAAHFGFSPSTRSAVKTPNNADEDTGDSALSFVKTA